jgi:hypothetical protein
LDLTLRATAKAFSVTIAGTAKPPGGFVLPWPWKTMPKTAMVDGERVAFRNGELTVPATGKLIRIELAR